MQLTGLGMFGFGESNITKCVPQNFTMDAQLLGASCMMIDQRDFSLLG
jgi:hypothetical protein